MIMPIAGPCKPHDCGDSYQSEVGHGETLLDCLFLHLVIFFTIGLGIGPSSDFFWRLRNTEKGGTVSTRLTAACRGGSPKATVGHCVRDEDKTGRLAMELKILPAVWMSERI